MSVLGAFGAACDLLNLLKMPRVDLGDDVDDEPLLDLLLNLGDSVVFLLSGTPFWVTSFEVFPGALGACPLLRVLMTTVRPEVGEDVLFPSIFPPLTSFDMVLDTNFGESAFL